MTQPLVRVHKLSKDSDTQTHRCTLKYTYTYADTQSQIHTHAHTPTHILQRPEGFAEAILIPLFKV